MRYDDAHKKTVEAHPETCDDLRDIINQQVKQYFDDFISGKLNLSEFERELSFELLDQVSHCITTPFRESMTSLVMDIYDEVERLEDKIYDLNAEISDLENS